MLKLIQKFFSFFFIDIATIWIVLKYLPEIQLAKEFSDLIVFCGVLALFNVLIKPLLDFLFKPVIWLTLGIFSVVINMALIHFINNYLKTLIIPNNFSLLKLTLIIIIANFLINFVSGIVLKQ